MRKLTWALMVGAVLSPLSLWAGPQDGTLTGISGQVELLTSPSKKLQADEKRPHALFEGTYYLYQPAKIGDRVGNGVYVRVAMGGKAQIIFDNGDQINLGSGTLFRPTWSKDTADASTAQPVMDIPFGKLHAVIGKGGPRTKLQLRSKTVVMGVRGTEFSVATADEADAAVSVLRGEVEVEVKQSAAAKGAPAKKFKVAENYTAQIGRTTGKPATLELKKTPKEDLASIQKLAEAPPAGDSAKKDAAIEKLEKKATEAAIKDVKEYHPELVAELGLESAKSASEIQTKLIEKQQQTAPAGGGKKSLYERDAKDLEEKAYKKYFESGT